MTPPRGRPRDPTIETTVLAVTRALLKERGFAATTIQEISRRSGVHPPAIYRRWPSRLALIEDAAFSTPIEISFTPTGRLPDDMRRFLREYARNLGSPAARVAMPGLLAGHEGDGARATARWMRLSVRPQFAAILGAAGDQVDPDLDIDHAFDVVLGAILARILVPTVAARRHWLDGTTDLIVRAVRPATTSTTSTRSRRQSLRGA